MAVHTPLKSDHQVLGEDFCSGYMDPFGNWNTGFPCPQLDEESPGLCCGVENLKYCCNGHGPRHIVNDVTHLPLVMGIVFGVSVAMIVSVVVCCFKCSCCLLYKKRQPANTGPLYHLHCPSSGSNGGVANMYSFSSEATPQDTPRSSTRSHCVGVNNRWSTTTADSGPGLLSLDHHLALLEEASPTPIHTPYRPHNHSDDHHSNSSSGGRIPSSARLSRALPDITLGLSREEEELPPPYNSNHSTLIAVRTNHGPQQNLYDHAAASNEVNSTINSNSRVSSIASSTSNHQESLCRVPPPISLPSHSSNSLPQGFPTFLQHQNHQQRNISSSGSASLRPQLIESRNQRHSIASIGTEDSFINGFSSFPPPPSETTASTAVTACNIFSLPAPPPPSFTLQQSPDLHHNHNQQQQQYSSRNNWPAQRSSSLYNNQRSSSSISSNSSSRTFAPVLSPTRRPCSTAHIIQMHNSHLSPDQQLHMYTATKF